MEAQIPSLVIALIFLGVIALAVTMGIILSPALAGRKDDEMRWNKLMEEGKRRFPGSPHRSMIEFLRRDRYQAIREATEKYQDITELSEDLTMLCDEIERIEEHERMIGGEAAVIVNHSSRL
ncbi:hypothetical protein [Zoogloea sp.]|uniref:hypothetical protein n=1 Tax=Zoogloea sp. TaxID=49181 RepID=UPI00141653C2|nr:MAG: hypothetical protein F9K15_12850 [Zoogloea sp.]